MKKAFGYALKIIALIFWGNALIGLFAIVSSFQNYSESIASIFGALLYLAIYSAIGYGFMRWSYKYEV